VGWFRRRRQHDRDTQYVATDLESGASQTFVIYDNLAPDWSGRHYRGGMSVPGAWRASLQISDLLGSVPWHAYRERGAGPIERLTPTPPLLDQPNPAETRMSTFSSWALDLVWEGNAVGIVAARNLMGWPTAVLPVPADMVMVRRVGLGANAGGLPVGSVEYNIGGQSFGPADIVHIKGPSAPGELRGMGVLECHLSTLTLARDQASQADSVSRHGVPTGLLKTTNPDATEQDLRDAKTAWMNAQAERTIASLNATTEFEPLSWNPEELQLVEARKFTLHELALIFGLPLYFLGADQSSRTYSNIEQEGLNLLKFSLGGHLARFEQTLTMHMPRGTFAKASLDAILRADTLTRYQAHAIAIDKRFLTVDEVRALEDRAPLPDQPETQPTDNPDAPPAAEDGDTDE